MRIQAGNILSTLKAGPMSASELARRLGVDPTTITRGEHFDSSAQGEQPKFTGRLAEGECIIKFSGRVAQVEVDSVANRWADLLHAEGLAATSDSTRV